MMTMMSKKRLQMPLNLFNPLLTSIDLLSGTRWSPFANLVVDDLPHDDDGDDMNIKCMYVCLGRFIASQCFQRSFLLVFQHGCTKSFDLSQKIGYLAKNGHFYPEKVFSAKIGQIQALLTHFVPC